MPYFYTLQILKQIFLVYMNSYYETHGSNKLANQANYTVEAFFYRTQN